MGAWQLPRPHFCFVVTDVVQRSAAARGAAKGAVQCEIGVRDTAKLFRYILSKLLLFSNFAS